MRRSTTPQITSMKPPAYLTSERVPRRFSPPSPDISEMATNGSTAIWSSSTKPRPTTPMNATCSPATMPVSTPRPRLISIFDANDISGSSLGSAVWTQWRAGPRLRGNESLRVCTLAPSCGHKRVVDAIDAARSRGDRPHVDATVAAFHAAVPHHLARLYPYIDRGVRSWIGLQTALSGSGHRGRLSRSQYPREFNGAPGKTRTSDARFRKLPKLDSLSSAEFPSVCVSWDYDLAVCARVSVSSG